MHLHWFRRVIFSLLLIACLLVPQVLLINRVTSNTRHENAVVLCTAVNLISGHISDFVVALEGPKVTQSERLFIQGQLAKDFKLLDCKAEPIHFK